ncbi:MAG: hypothetical protein UV79_C0001G0043 [candidate division TM6 bacterium GW2011_GWF2_43_17]|nr:MAG: hypothetical protein UV79_C0001G0043 [candidate division TM6 bacterium GW2011_GWF2_43_17]HAU30110.1 hypothetical protein [Candidatus Dependentiae bacterium]
MKYLLIALSFGCMQLCTACEWWDAACHARQGSGVFQPVNEAVRTGEKVVHEAVTTVQQGAETVKKAAESVLQTGRDLVGGAQTFVEADLFGKLNGALLALQGMQKDVLGDTESINALNTYIKNVSESFAALAQAMGEIDKLPDSVTPAELGQKVVFVSDKLATINHLSQVTVVFRNFLRLVEPVANDLLQILLRFAQNSGRQDMERLYRKRLDQSSTFFSYFSPVLHKVGSEWDRLAPEVTDSIKGAGQLLQSMSGMIVFVLQLGNMTTKELLEGALKGGSIGAGMLNAAEGLSIHTLASGVDSLIKLPNEAWSKLNRVGSQLGSLFDYGFDELLPKVNKALLLVDDRLGELAKQKAGFAKVHSIALLLSYLTPVLLELSENQGLFDQLMVFLKDLTNDLFEIMDRSTLKVGGVFEIGPRFKGIEQDSIIQLIEQLQKVRIGVLGMLEKIDQELPKVAEMLQPLAKVHAQAIGENLLAKQGD